MLKRILALLLALCLLAPAALAQWSVSAQTSLSGASDAKLNNIRLAVAALDGATVPSGHSFSFNEQVGPRVKRRGYLLAPNGRGAVVTGGGVAQVATTLYLALLKLGDDVEIGPVKTYGSRFTDNYVSDPDQAIITDYDADIDLSFTNLGDDFNIGMWISDRSVCCRLTVDDNLTSGQGASVSWVPVDEDSDPSFTLYVPGDDFTAIHDEDDDTEFYSDYDDEAASVEYFGGYDRLPSPDELIDYEPEGDLLGSAFLYCGDDRDLRHNIELAAGSVNDTTLDSHDTFSFNEIVGPRTKKYGYRSAVNGRGVRVVGGGVAQVASVIWLAVKDADDISIIEKSTYGGKYNQSYVESSSDAILTDYASGRDFSFRYTGKGSITVFTLLDDGWLYCDVYHN